MNNCNLISRHRLGLFSKFYPIGVSLMYGLSWRSLFLANTFSWFAASFLLCRRRLNSIRCFHAFITVFFHDTKTLSHFLCTLFGCRIQSLCRCACVFQCKLFFLNFIRTSATHGANKVRVFISGRPKATQQCCTKKLTISRSRRIFYENISRCASQVMKFSH